MIELREAEKRRDEDRRRVEELRKAKAEVIERMERRKRVDARLEKDFPTSKDLWIRLAEKGVENERLKEKVEGKRKEMAEKKSRAEELKAKIAMEKETAAAAAAAAAKQRDQALKGKDTRSRVGGDKRGNEGGNQSCRGDRDISGSRRGRQQQQRSVEASSRD